MRAVIKSSRAFGKIHAPASKSMAHRLLIAAALSGGTSRLYGVTPCEDVLATVDILSHLGAVITNEGDTYTVRGINIAEAAPKGELFCRESGSTLRFIIPLVSLTNKKVILSGAPSLMSRPMSVYEEIFEKNALTFLKKNEKIELSGALTCGEYTVRGDISSQFITGLLFALPLLNGDSVIHIIPPLESKSYIEMSVSALSKFGILIDTQDPLNIKIKGNQRYMPCNLSVEGDFSGTAFLDALNLFGSSVEVLGLSEDSKQGDRVYRELFPMLKTGSPVIDISNCPDLGPILFTAAAALQGATFTGTRRLKIKESDRVETMASELKKLGADIEIFENSVTIKKSQLHAPKEILHGHNDHRVVMSLAVLLTNFGGTIDGAEAVAKSYPAFFDDIKSLGVEVRIYE